MCAPQVDCIDLFVDGALHAFGTVNLTTPLSYSHYANRHEYQAEVGLLSRRIIIRGDELSPPTDPQPADMYCSDTKRTDIPCHNYYLTGHGGHLLVQDNAVAQISAVEFTRMGRTNEVGRYPVHLHMLGPGGSRSFVKDCAIHESYYRGVVLHSTNNSLVTRNVAYDVTGHCFYLEAGNEEGNEISFNLGSHIHPIGFAEDMTGQETGRIFEQDSTHPAVIPADIAASPFYFPNLQNNFTGNAAAGSGFAGFTMVNFPHVINGGDFTPDDFVPEDRPTMASGFYGNSCRSVGWFWNLAPCFYVGGVLWEDSHNNNKLKYIPGRVTSRSQKRHPKSIVDGSDTWNVFVNSRAALCPVANGDWNVRGRWYNVDIVDLGERSMNAFGDQSFRNVYLKCRSTNEEATMVTPANTWDERMWPDLRMKGFRSYDSGQRHVVSDWLIDCGSEGSPLMDAYDFRSAQIWSFPHGVNINQFQIIFRNISYVDKPDPKKLFSFDVGSKDTYSPFYMCFEDADGSMSGRHDELGRDCAPAIAGTAGKVRSVSSGGDDNNLMHFPANMWFKLTGLDDASARGTNTGDSRCSLRDEAEYPMWVCDKGRVNLAAFEPMPNNRGETSARTKMEFGRLAHWGDSIAQGVPMSGQAQIVGPFEHSQRGGWFLRFYQGGADNSTWAAPRSLEIDRVQMSANQVLIIAMQYPSGTSFEIERR